MTPSLSELIESLSGENYHLTAIVDDFGEASKCLSSKGIYSFLLSNFFDSKLQENCFSHDYQRYFQAQSFIGDHNIDRILIEKNDSSRELVVAASEVIAGQKSDTSSGNYLSISPVIKAKSQGSMIRQWAAARYALVKAVKGFNKRLYFWFKAFIEGAISFLLLLLTVPLLAVLLLRKNGKIRSRAILGKSNHRLYAHLFENGEPGSGELARWWWLPTLWNVCKGDLALIGPRIIFLDAEDNYQSNNYQSDLFYQQAPGLISRSQLKANGLSTAQLDELDQAYMHSCGPILDLKIMLLAASKLLLSRF